MDDEKILENLIKFRNATENLFYRNDVSDEKKTVDKLIKKVRKGHIEDCLKEKEK